MREAEVIARLQAIATDPAARHLTDDVAVLDGLIITHDSIAEGVHFLPSDPPASVGWKLVAVNLSDLAGKGATPAGALLSLTICGDDEWEAEFLTGIEAACESYALPLIGGDTIALPAGAPRVLGLTALGRAGERVPHRADGKPGDRLWLVGTVGDSTAGLAQLHGDPRATGPLVDAFRRPIPQLGAGQVLAPHAHAMMDVSDGLLLDALRMAEASGCAAVVDLDVLPLSADFRAVRGESREERLFAATGGDDYALLGAFDPDFDPSTLNLPKGTRITAVGAFEAGDPAIRLISNGRPVELPERLGHEHRGLSSAPMADRP
ncbi:thiamine-phosphate kinase [Sphingomonas sp. URHD0057]|uniref:thiamine-phosphate kinase n=1 Tax=Sphingomonas sp. URHD0057 TaxID=1380389 RepID=UPI00049099DE|nr:thiamine-phosphate kinase [Sphingomonas sp. URHD0057]